MRYALAMRPGALLAVLAFALAVAAVRVPMAEVWRALLVAPLLLWVPGRSFPVRAAGALERELAAVGISLAVLVPAVIAARMGAGPSGLLGVPIAAWAVGRVWAGLSPVPRPRWTTADRAAVGLVLAVVGTWSWRDRLTIGRDLDRYWYHPAVEAGFAGADPVPRAGEGWAVVGTSVGQREPGWWGLPSSETPQLRGPARGTVLLLLSGPVGAGLTVGDRSVTVTREVTEDPEEGPVPRYLDAGIAALAVDLDLGPDDTLTLLCPDPERTRIRVVPSVEAAWELHAIGALRHVHYYQLLNMVEQLRWSAELVHQRWVTDVQPPGWSWVLAAVREATGGGLVTANVLFVVLLVPLGLAGVATVRAWAPRAHPLAWAVPVATLPVQAKLLLEPGSAGMPDTAYTFALAMVALGLARGPRVAGWALAAQLLRYPATLVTGLMAVLAGRPAALARIVATVLTAMAAFGVAGQATGALDRWLATVGWEIGPEHWHGEFDPGVLLGRVPGFYALWVAYAGGTPLLAAARWTPGVRATLGAALLYSLLLCTIDHRPSHYFLPLVHLAAVGLGISTDGWSGRLPRLGLPLLGIAGLLTSALYVNVVG